MSEVPAVLLVLFRRPEVTARVFAAIREARPTRLYLAADGPRSGVSGEAERCRLAREAVSNVDWPCEVKTFFRDENVGVRRGVSEAITWFFAHEEEGIIFEDDCRPGPEFFPFCRRVLDLYRDDGRVMHVSGTNFQPGRRVPGRGYFFSRYNHVWGWATWRRAWEKYRADLDDLEEFLREARGTGFWENRRERVYWTKIFRQVAQGRVESWAYRWQYTVWREGALCVYPDVNLVSNLGFGEGATNTVRNDGRSGDRPLETLGTWGPNSFVQRHRPADRHTFDRMYWGTPVERLQLRIHQISRLLRGNR